MLLGQEALGWSGSQGDPTPKAVMAQQDWRVSDKILTALCKSKGTNRSKAPWRRISSCSFAKEHMVIAVFQQPSLLLPQ